MRVAAVACLALVLGVSPAWAEPGTVSLCTPEFKVEPTISFTTPFKSPRIILDNGAPARDRRETDFELMSLSNSSVSPEPVADIVRCGRSPNRSSARVGREVLLNLCERDHHHHSINRTVVESGTYIETLRVV